jgi:deoxyribodipyrimidine photolyase-related protein
MSSKITLRLVLGDQLNIQHSWFATVDESVTYVLMEIRSETDYATHHIQKVAGFFAAMRQFAQELRDRNHKVIYIRLNEEDNLHAFDKNIAALIERRHFTCFEYQLPDEYRVDEHLRAFCTRLGIETNVVDSEHFFSNRTELADFFEGKKVLLMERFYQAMRKKHHVLMDGDMPVGGQWNYDKENRKKLLAGHKCSPPLVFPNDVTEIAEEIRQANVQTMGSIDARHFVWPVSRAQSLALLAHFVDVCLPLFGTYEDAMTPNEWSLYHSRLSFSMNLKMISPREVIDKAIEAWQERPREIGINQLEGFVRQILGWREYMRGIYWMKMPEFGKLNFFDHRGKLPEWYWTGETKMRCLSHSIRQSLQYAYAHHIQRLMVTGNFALLAGVHPDEVDAWYLGIYIDALEWVEITNTRGMSQFADGGMVATKPYVSSAAYIDKMSHYCGSCYYKKSLKTGDRACPFNSLYWHFYNRHEGLLGKNNRIGMMYNVWQRMDPGERAAILQQAEQYLSKLDEL